MRSRSAAVIGACVAMACLGACHALEGTRLRFSQGLLDQPPRVHDDAVVAGVAAGATALIAAGSRQQVLARSVAVASDEPDPLSIERVDAGPEIAVSTAVQRSLLSEEALAHPALSAIQGLVDELGTHPWTRETWDPFGFSDLSPEGRVYLTEDGQGNVIAQPPGHTGLNCLGAYTEALRAAYVPTLSIDDLEPCIREPRPKRCAASSTGARVIKYSKQLLSPRYEVGRVARQNVIPGGTLRAVPDFPTLGLCVVSHASSVHEGRRYFHHMIITSRLASGLYVLFDATAANGLRLTEVTALKLRAYVRDDLSHNAKLGFSKESARLSCLPVGAAKPAATQVGGAQMRVAPAAASP